MARRSRRRNKRGILDIISAFTFFAIVAIAAAWFEHSNREAISLGFTAVDGDSLKSGDIRIRLIGIDAPEFNQICTANSQDYKCGRKARDHLRSLIAQGHPTVCYHEADDKYGRQLAECFAGDINLNEEMVASGWAISYGGYSMHERSARKQKLGLWAGDFDRPDKWRARYGGILEGNHSALFKSWWRSIMSWFDTGDS